MVLSKKYVVLTGATGGIGQEVARALDKEGCRLLLTGRNQEKLNSLLKSLKGVNHHAVCADLQSEEGREALLNMAKKHSVDILINMLGVNQLCLADDMTDKNIDEIVSTNLIVPMKLCRDFIPLLGQQESSVIVNVGSILGSIGYAGSSAYCGSKFGLRGFTESLRRELAATTTKVLYFAPRATSTALNTFAMQSMNQELGTVVDEPAEVARQLVLALKKGSRLKMYYLGWPEAFFVRLNGLLPNIVDKALFKKLAIIRRYAESKQS